jgi:hypothetical protein
LRIGRFDGDDGRGHLLRLFGDGDTGNLAAERPAPGRVGFDDHEGSRLASPGE